MKKFLGLTTAILALLVFSGTARAESFTVYLNGAQEVPATATGATGRGRIVLDTTTNMITFTITFTGLSSAQTLSHIHSPAPIGVSTGVTVNFGTVGGTSGTISGTAAVTATIIGHMRSGQAYVNIHSANFPGGEIRGQIAKNRPVDYDGDGRNDFSVWRYPNPPPTPPAVGQVTYWNLRSTDGPIAQDFGDVNTDYPTPGDYDGDGKGDLALFRHDAASTAGADTFFLVLRSSNSTLLAVRWGVTGDLPVARDYDGDGITDMAVFRPGAVAGDPAYWYIRQSASNNVQRTEQFGTTGDGTNNYDTPVPGDYDGDGKFDLAVFRFALNPADNYIIKRSSDNAIQYVQWGNFTTDYVLPGDYDGDGKFDFCAGRTGAGSTPITWYILRTSDGGTTVRTFGISTDLPTQGDYDGDGRCDISVYRRGATLTSQSTFHYIASLDNTVRSQIWGLRADFPVNTFDAR
jgi:hypothetical protein